MGTTASSSSTIEEKNESSATTQQQQPIIISISLLRQLSHDIILHILTSHYVIRIENNVPSTTVYSHNYEKDIYGYFKNDPNRIIHRFFRNVIVTSMSRYGGTDEKFGRYTPYYEYAENIAMYSVRESNYETLHTVSPLYLKTLKIASTDLTDKRLMSVCERGLPMLQSLDVNVSLLKPNTQTIQYLLKQCPKIARLMLRYSHVPENCLFALTPSVTYLNLSGNRFGNIPQITGDYLQSLSLRDNLLTSGVLSKFNIRRLPQLTELDISLNYIGDNGAIVLSEYKQLRKLFANGCEIEKDGAQLLLSCNNLIHLSLNNNFFSVEEIIDHVHSEDDDCHLDILELSGNTLTFIGATKAVELMNNKTRAPRIIVLANMLSDDKDALTLVSQYALAMNSWRERSE
jgi:hypothetical protein